MIKSTDFSIRAILLCIIAMLNLQIAVLVNIGVYKSWRSLEQAMYLQDDSRAINLFYEANKHLSLARGAALSVMKARPEITESLHETLAENWKLYDEKINEALSQIETRLPHSPDREKISKKHQTLQNLYQELEIALTKPPNERDLLLPGKIFDASMDLIGQINALILSHSRSMQNIDATVSRYMIFKNFVWELTEYAGQENALIGKVIVERKSMTLEEQNALISLRERIEYGWEIVRNFSLDDSLTDALTPYMDEAESHYFESFSSIKNFFYLPASDSSSYPISVGMWLELASQAVDSLLALQDTALQETQNHIDQIEYEAKREIIASVIIFFCALALSLYCWSVIVLRVTRPVNAMVNALFKVTRGEEYDPPRISHYHDEIGKLASVLDVLQENTRKIKQSNEELERYAYITAHDLKSPLRAIDNLSEWIEEDLGPALNGKTKEHMTTLRQRVRRMERLLNDILEYSRIDRRVESADNEVTNGKVLIEDAILLAAPSKDFTIKINPGFAHINLGRTPLQQVFYNLINNALKHHDKAAGTIEIDLFENETHYVFSVKDDGPGIPQQYHERIFEMFQTLKPRDQREGSGMGLAFVKKILNSCHGTIDVQSKPGEGTLFRFTWPKSSKETNNAQPRDA